MIPPNKLRFPSDNNELVFESEQKPTAHNKLKEMCYTYRYTLSNSKYNTTVTVTKTELDKWLKRGTASPF